MSEFLLLGLPIHLEQQDILFALFLGIHLTTVLGNLFIILLIRLVPQPHTPRYFFFSHLALKDIYISSVTVHKMLMDMDTRYKSICYTMCIAHIYFFIFFLLTSMAYGR